MTKEEMKLAWTKQWDETKQLFDFVCKEYEFQVNRQQKYLEENKTAECHAMSGCIVGLRAIKQSLEAILYKEI